MSKAPKQTNFTEEWRRQRKIESPELLRMQKESFANRPRLAVDPKQNTKVEQDVTRKTPGGPVTLTQDGKDKSRNG